VQHADFFDDSNENAANIRQKAAELALEDTLSWLEEETTSDEDDDETGYASGSLFIGHTSHSSRRQTQRIAIFDATNSTKARRNWILQQCDKASEVSGKETGVVFVESICDDKELLTENYNIKISSSPDFEGMSREEALADLKERIEKYEARYETIDDDSSSYIKVFNLSSKLLVNHFYGRLAKVIVPALMAWNVGSRPIFLCRSGETSTAASPRPLQPEDRRASDLSSHGHITKRQRGDRLTERGLEFRNALCKFVEQEGMEYMEKSTNVVHPRKFDTGTSMSGLREHRREEPLFPCLIMSSTIPRALETAKWESLPFPIKDVSNLNPLDMGDFTGMTLESIRTINPEWYYQLEQEPFHTR
jgi:chaperonin cofactor prefoldin